MDTAQASCKGAWKKCRLGVFKAVLLGFCGIKSVMSEKVRASKDARPDARQLCCFVIVPSSAGFANGEVPYNQTEENFVHKICEVIDHIECALINTTEHVTPDVPDWVNRPAYKHNESHVVER